jgi:hypothetical protein
MAKKLFDKASLVMIPSQYKEGRIYNIKPEDQSSAFEFSRGSLATRVNENGLIQRTPTNGIELVVNGGFDADSDWDKNSGITISDGKSNFSGLSGRYLSQEINISSGKIYKIDFTVLNGSNDLTIFLGAANNIYSRDDYNIGQNTIYAVAGGVDSIIYFGNLFIGSIDNISIQEVNADTPRLDYSGTETSLLLEPQRTNFVTYSENFSEWDVGTGGISIDTGYLAPDGSNNATKVTMDSNFSTTALALNLGLGTTETRTIYARTVSGTGQANLCSFNGNTNNLFTITEDWQRFEVNGAISTGAVSFYGVDFRGSTDLNEIIIWGAQAEEGSYPTSYIPTNGSAETRLTDICEEGGDESTFNDSEGVLYAEISTSFEGSSGVKSLSVQYDASNYVAIYFRDNNSLSARVAGSGNVTQVDTSYATNTLYKIAVSYNSTNVKFYVNGTQVDIETTNTLPISLNKLSFDRGGEALTNMNGKCKALTYFPEALTDTELQELTTI